LPALESTTTQAFIVPITSDTQVILGHAIYEWEEILELMIAHEKAYKAVQDANAFLHQRPADVYGNPITEYWKVDNAGANNVTLY